MKLSNIIAGISFITLLISSCTIYRSPQRKDFESESPQFRVENLKAAGCSGQTIRTKATSKRLVTILHNSISSDTNKESEFLWEYIIDQQSVFESDNLKGVYCVYDND